MSTTSTVLTVLGGLSLTGIIVALSIENKKNVDDYNKLLEKANTMSDFIKNHDFYVKNDNQKQQTTQKQTNESRYVIEDEYIDADYNVCTVKRDIVSGFSVIHKRKATEKEIQEALKEVN